MKFISDSDSTILCEQCATTSRGGSLPFACSFVIRGVQCFVSYFAGVTSLLRRAAKICNLIIRYRWCCFTFCSVNPRAHCYLSRCHSVVRYRAPFMNHRYLIMFCNNYDVVLSNSWTDFFGLGCGWSGVLFASAASRVADSGFHIQTNSVSVLTTDV